MYCFFFFSSRRRHTRCSRDWSSDVCSSDLLQAGPDSPAQEPARNRPGDSRRGGRAARGSRGRSQGSRQPGKGADRRSEEHTSELQSRLHLVCRLLLEKKKTNNNEDSTHWTD